MKKSSDPILGNASEELGQFEEGKDFQNIGSVTVSTAPEPISVTVTTSPQGTYLIPQQRTTAEFHRELGELEESPASQIMHELTEETHVPVLCESKERLAQVTKREHLVWYGIRPNMLGAMNGDRILVEQDTLESEHSCRECKGKGHSEQLCMTCNGTGQDPQSDLNLPCSSCRVSTFDEERQYSCGHVPCSSCLGSGWRAGIIIPEIAQSKPVSGVVVSLGPQTQLLRLGDRILHSKYAGNSFTTPEGKTYTMMHESEFLMLLKQRGN